MAPQTTVQRSLAGGELAPALHARADTAKYQTGLRRCRNFIVQRHGGITNRAGFRHILLCKTTSITVALMRYVSENAGESMLLEVGNGYIRFFLNGALLNINGGTVAAWGAAVDYVIGDLVSSGGVFYYALKAGINHAPPNATYWWPLVGTVFELPNPFGADLPNWQQSGRTITLTHKNHAPYELINGGGLVSWVLRAVVTLSAAKAPVGVGLTPGAAGTLTVGYVVTSALAVTYEESGPSAQVINAATAAPTAVAPNVLTWTLDPTAAEYYVYKDEGGNGTYGYIGTATGAATFKDPGLTPDYVTTAPTPQARFATAGEYPNVSASFQQRRWFGYTTNHPDEISGSRIGFPSNFDISSPLQDDDAVTFRLAGNNHHPVRHLLAVKGLIAMTDAGEWTVTGGGQNPLSPITPSSIEADQQTYIGASTCRPVVVGNSIIYVQARGANVHDLQFDQQVEGLGGRDLSIYAAHLFDGHTLSELDYAQNPHSIVWAVREDGTLLGLTYIREQDVWGWHRHDTGASGRFEHVCVVPELGDDAVYVIVRRTIGGVFKRSIEKLEKRLITNLAVDGFFVDAGLSYFGTPVNNVAGLGHLEGQVVAVVGDGVVVFNGDPAAANAANFTVTGGTLPVALPASYAAIHAGLPIRFAEFETLDLDVAGSSVRDKEKNVSSLSLLLEASDRSFQAGPDSADLTPVRLEPWEVPSSTFDGLVSLAVTSAFTEQGRVFVRHTEPTPLTVLGVLPNVEVGG
jgi:hypothetical protein